MPRFLTDVPGLPDPASPISHAVISGNHCWISGQLSTDEQGRYIPGTPHDEAARAFTLIFRIAEAAGFSRADIVYVDLAFLDLADLPAVNDLYAELFADGHRPARTIYQAAQLPYGARIKVQAVAARD